MPHKKSASKRANNEGSVYRNKKGLWIAQATIGYDENGKQIRKAVSGKTRSDAIVNLAPYLPKNGARKQLIFQDMPMRSHMQFWLMKYKKRTIAARTFERYIGNAKRYIYPYMGGYLPQNITTNLLQDFLGGMLDKGYALDTVKHIKYQLRQYFEYCIDEEIIDKNPMGKVRLQTKERKTGQAAEQQEYKAIPEELRDRFLQAVGTSVLFKPLCLTSMFAGLRIGEVLGLKWKDFDEKNKTLSVVRAQTVEPTFDENGNVTKREYMVGKTKTAGSTRVIPIPDLLVNILHEWKTLRVLQELMTKAPVSKSDDFIFANNQGKMRSYYGTRTMFNRLLKKHGMEEMGIHFYRLRHTFSNTLFEAQENPKVIQMLMGHKKVETTMIYNTATTNKYLQKAVDVFDERYAPSEPVPAPQPAEKPSAAVAGENKENSGNELLQNISRLLGEYNVSSLNELMKAMDGERPKSNK
ncbi:MAG TPA: site-specific integrase [Firmicutes bacterium]|nr:site-specific integrase [Bacillota bacterium]